MTDLQLAMLLRGYCYQLNTELERLREQLPDHRVVRPGLMGSYDTWPVLDGVIEFKNELAASAEKLERNNDK